MQQMFCLSILLVLLLVPSPAGVGVVRIPISLLMSFVNDIKSKVYSLELRWTEYFLKIPYPLLGGTFWKKKKTPTIKWIFSHPPKNLIFVTKTAWKPPTRTDFCLKCPYIWRFRDTLMMSIFYFCLKCDYMLDLFNFGCQTVFHG